jgi:hypothetical protein
MHSLTHSGTRAALDVAAVVARVLAVALCVLVVVDSLDLGTLHTVLLDVNGFVSNLVPQSVSGLLVFRTPMGGAFRGDFALAATALFVIDWLLARAAYRI